MGKLLRAMASAFSDKKPNVEQPHVGVFSVVHGKRGSLEKLGTRATDTKCAGDGPCKCG